MLYAAFLGKFWKPVGLGCLRGEIRCQQKLSGWRGRVGASRMEGGGQAWRGVQSAGSRETQSAAPSPPLRSQCRRPGTRPAANEQAQDTGVLPTGHSRGHLAWSLPHNHNPLPPSPAAPRQPLSSTVATVPSTPGHQVQGSGLAFAETAQDAPEGADRGS